MYAPHGAMYAAAPGAIYAAGYAPANPAAFALFQQVDRDRSGSISLPELHYALTHGGYVGFSVKAARLLMRNYDADRSGALSYFEFEKLLATLTHWKAAFDAQTHGTGKLTPAGLLAIVSGSGFALPPPLVAMMFNAFDENASGTLTFDEYIQAHSELTSLTHAFQRHDPSRCGRATLDFASFLVRAAGGLLTPLL